MNQVLRIKDKLRARNSCFLILNSGPRGFSLVELLVVLAIMSFVTGLAGAIFLSVVRSNNKANIVNEIQQNGNFILQNLEGSLRNARAVTTPSTLNTASSTLTYLDKNNQLVTYQILPGRIQLNGQDISNSDSIIGVYVDETGSSFTLISSSPQSVRVTIVLRQATNAPGRIDYKATTTFQTTVSLRTY